MQDYREALFPGIQPCKILLILSSSPVLLPQICANLWRPKKGPARAISSVVERLLHTQEVAGSNPASRSVFASCFRVLRWLNPLPKERGRFDFPLCDSIKDSLGVESATPARKSPGELKNLLTSGEIALKDGNVSVNVPASTALFIGR